jgi:hypothetical protein
MASRDQEQGIGTKALWYLVAVSTEDQVKGESLEVHDRA